MIGFVVYADTSSDKNFSLSPSSTYTAEQKTLFTHPTNKLLIPEEFNRFNFAFAMQKIPGLTSSPSSPYSNNNSNGNDSGRNPRSNTTTTTAHSNNKKGSAGGRKNGGVVVRQDSDVLFGRGRIVWEGNQRFQNVTKVHATRYHNSKSRTEKSRVVTDVIETVHAWGGRFLSLQTPPRSSTITSFDNAEEMSWTIATDSKIRKKIGQALRYQLVQRYRSTVQQEATNLKQDSDEAQEQQISNDEFASSHNDSSDENCTTMPMDLHEATTGTLTGAPAHIAAEPALLLPMSAPDNAVGNASQFAPFTNIHGNVAVQQASICLEQSVLQGQEAHVQLENALREGIAMQHQVQQDDDNAFALHNQLPGGSTFLDVAAPVAPLSSPNQAPYAAAASGNDDQSESGVSIDMVLITAAMELLSEDEGSTTNGKQQQKEDVIDANRRLVLACGPASTYQVPMAETPLAPRPTFVNNNNTPMFLQQQGTNHATPQHQFDLNKMMMMVPNMQPSGAAANLTADYMQLWSSFISAQYMSQGQPPPAFIPGMFPNINSAATDAATTVPNGLSHSSTMAYTAGGIGSDGTCGSCNTLDALLPTTDEGTGAYLMSNGRNEEQQAMSGMLTENVNGLQHSSARHSLLNDTEILSTLGHFHPDSPDLVTPVGPSGVSPSWEQNNNNNDGD
ncbi:hypothetical protein ACA910_004502 [Epithemia clementina (nom. ined.)]